MPRNQSTILFLAAERIRTLALSALLGITIWQANCGTATAQPIVRQDFWVTDGPVVASALSGSTLYIGGSFGLVAPPAAAGGVPISSVNGAPLNGFPKVTSNSSTGSVYAVAPDGSGGWYIGGSFTAVGGIARANIARILSDGSVSSWNPGASDTVRALAASGSRVYAGGVFASIGGQPRSRIAALDATTGLALPGWKPDLDSTGCVYALAVSGPAVYVGGRFSSIGAKPRNNLSVVDTTGSVAGWDPNANGTISALAVNGTTVYAGGTFDSLGVSPRNNIGALDATTGLPTSWNPNAASRVLALAVSGTAVYAGGEFDSIGGQPRSRIAALDASTGTATAWDPGVGTSFSSVGALALSGTTVYVGGSFKEMGGQPRNNIGAVDATTGLATAWDPKLNAPVHALYPGAGVIYAGGDFTGIGGYRRNNIAALNASTGIPTSWDPNADRGVLALAASGTRIYAAGLFDNIGGQVRNSLAALDSTTGLALTTWNPNPNSIVQAIAVSGSAVYVGGYFTSMGDSARSYIAVVDSATGLVPGWNPNADKPVFALTVNGLKVYAGGDFLNIGGQARSRIAALDATTGLATTWNPGADSTVYCLGFGVEPGTGLPTVYAGGDFTSIGGGGKGVAALGAVSGSDFWPDLNPSRTVRTLAVSDGDVYVGGGFSGLGGLTRFRLAVIRSGNVGIWNPGASVTSIDGFLSDVSTLAVSGTYVYAGGSFGAMGKLPQSYIASITRSLNGSGVAEPRPTAGVTAVRQNAPNPFSASTGIRFSLASPSKVTLRVFDVSGREVRTLTRPALGAGAQVVTWDGEDAQGRNVSSGVYYYEVLAGGVTKRGRMALIR